MSIQLSQKQGITIGIIAVAALLAIGGTGAYSTLSRKNQIDALTADLTKASQQIRNHKEQTGLFLPNGRTLVATNETAALKYVYNNTKETYCVTATDASLSGKAFHIAQDGDIQEGSCPSASAVADSGFVPCTCGLHQV